MKKSQPLPDCAIFKGLSQAALNILGSAPRVRFRKGATLWTAGSEAHGLIVVLSGRVRVVRAPAGRQYAIHTEEAGGTLGDVPFFAGGLYPATAIAVEPSACLTIDRATLSRIFAIEPEFAFKLLRSIASRVRGLLKRLDQQNSLTVEQRTAAFLLARAEVSGNLPFELAATQAEAAEEIGTVREVLVRILRRFREERIIESVQRGKYLVRNRARLKALVPPQ